MKIHGTAKGGALSTKDFGVAFGGAAGCGDFEQLTGSANQDTFDYTGQGIGINGAGSKLIGCTPTKFSMYLAQQGNPTGNAYAVIMDYRDPWDDGGNIIVQSNNVDVSTIAHMPNQDWVEWTFDESNRHVLEQYDCVAVVYLSGTGSKYLVYKQQTTSQPFDTGQSFFVVGDLEDDDAWDSSYGASMDCRFKLTTV
jgi:hypothetical protein